METFLYPDSDVGNEMGELKKVLIATLYQPEPVLLAANRLGPDRIILLVDREGKKEQDKSFKLINDSLGRVVDVKKVQTKVYDIVAVAKKCVEIIDMQPKDDLVFVNITSGRKTKALGLLYAAYARCSRVSRIAYNPEDQSSVIYLPKLGFALTESQKDVLAALEDEKNSKLSFLDLAEKIGISRAMLYRNIDDLKKMDYISSEDGLKLTDAGRIARL